MINLWPTDLLESHVRDNQATLERLLEAQAKGLSLVSLGAVQGEIRKDVIDPVTVYRFRIWPRGQTNSIYELFRVRSLNEKPHFVVEVNHFDESDRSRKSSSLDTLERTLEIIFAAQKTREIIRLIANEALEDGTVTTPPQSDSPIPERAIYIGAIFDQNGKQYSQVSFLGIAGFVERTTLQTLSIPPTSKGSAYERLNDQFVVTLSFSGSVKMSLSATEMNTLIGNAKRELAKV